MGLLSSDQHAGHESPRVASLPTLRHVHCKGVPAMVDGDERVPDPRGVWVLR